MNYNSSFVEYSHALFNRKERNATRDVLTRNGRLNTVLVDFLTGRPIDYHGGKLMSMLKSLMCDEVGYI